MTKIGRKTVLITGATGKLGRTFALGFAADGWSVAFTSRGGDAAVELEQACLRAGAERVLCVHGDLLAENVPSRIAHELDRAGFLPDTLVNNARDMAHLKSGVGGRLDRKNWHGEFALGVVIPYELTMTLADLQQTPLKSVINVASMYGITAPNLQLYDEPERESPVNYGVTKAALIHLTKELAVRLASQGIAVNAVSYGGVSGRVDEKFRVRYERLCPAGRMLEDPEVFGAVRFLASSDASGMTGHNLIVDGGWTIW